MTPRLAFALLTAVFLVAAPATASAQAPVDERANARAFADIGLQLSGAIEAAAPAMDAGFAKPPACFTTGALARRLQRVPERRSVPLSDFYATQVIGAFARTVDPAIVQGLADMHAIHTADNGLRGGRTAWRRIHRVYESFAALPAVDVCAEGRAFVGNGLRRTPAMRRAQRAIYAADHTGGIDLRLQRAVKRLTELGVPAAEADLFDGPFGDE